VTSTQITLHIGAPKTGSSSVQGFLKSNHKLLQQYGLFYPTGEDHPALAVSPHHHLLVHALTPMMQHWFDFPPSEAHRILMKILADAKSDPDTKQILLSHEMLYNNIERIDANVLKDLVGQDPVRILVYARRLDDWNESLYRQFIWGRLQPRSTVHHGQKIPMIQNTPHVREMEARGVRFVAEAYSRMLPQAEFIVRPYSAFRIGDGVIPDFLKALDLPHQEILANAAPQERLNQSRPVALTILLWHLQQTELPTDVIFRVSRAGLKMARHTKPPMEIESRDYRFLPPEYAQQALKIYTEDVNQFPSLAVDGCLTPWDNAVPAELTRDEQKRVFDWLAPKLQSDDLDAVASVLA
jgi:hypothetical protein